MSELKRCPFCGGEAEVFADGTTTYGFLTPNYCVRCVMENCIGYDIESRYTVMEEAVEDWNRRAPEWISVKERLPEKPTYDWVLVQTGRRVENFYGVPFIAELRNGKWHTDYHCLSLEEVLDEEVTHWMPLPEPPKGGA